MHCWHSQCTTPTQLSRHLRTGVKCRHQAAELAAHRFWLTEVGMSRSTIMLKFCPFQDSNDSLSFQHKLRCQTWYMYGMLVYGRSSKHNEWVYQSLLPYENGLATIAQGLGKQWPWSLALSESETHWLSSTWETAERLLSQMSLSEELGESPKESSGLSSISLWKWSCLGYAKFLDTNLHLHCFASDQQDQMPQDFSEPCSHPLHQQVSYFLNRPQRFHLQGGKHNVPSPQMTGSHAWKTHVRMGIYNMLLGEFTNKWKRGPHTVASQFQSMSPNYAKWSISISKAQNWQAGIFLCEAS